MFIAQDGITKEMKANKQIEESMKVLIVQVGTSSRNPDGTYDDYYEQTLYVFHNDWLMSDGKKLFVVDEHYIKTFTEITEEEFVEAKKLRKEDR
jgi:hypothetical protein